MFPTPTITAHARAAVNVNVRETVRNCHDLVEQYFMKKDGIPPLVPEPCVNATATFWAYLRNKSAKLLYWQFKYTVGAISYRTRLSHLPGHTPTPAERMCRNCNNAEETREHLFITCVIALQLRNRWAHECLRGTATTHDQQLLLWERRVQRRTRQAPPPYHPL